MTEPVGATTPPWRRARGARQGVQPRQLPTPRYPMLRRTKERLCGVSSHGQQTRTTLPPFAHTPLLPFPEEFYNCFVFNSPWSTPVQGLQFSNHHRHSRVLHIGFYQNRKADRTAALLRALVSTPVKRSSRDAPGHNELRLPLTWASSCSAHGVVCFWRSTTTPCGPDVPGSKRHFACATRSSARRRRRSMG